MGTQLRGGGASVFTLQRKHGVAMTTAEQRDAGSTPTHRVTSLRTAKTISQLFAAKLQALRQTNEHTNVRKTNYYTNKVQVCYCAELPQPNFPDYTNSLTFPRLWAFSPNLSWRRGSVVRMSVCSRRTFPDLRLIHG